MISLRRARIKEHYCKQGRIVNSAWFHLLENSKYLILPWILYHLFLFSFYRKCWIMFCLAIREMSNELQSHVISKRLEPHIWLEVCNSYFLCLNGVPPRSRPCVMDTEKSSLILHQTDMIEMDEPIDKWTVWQTDWHVQMKFKFRDRPTVWFLGSHFYSP